MLRQLLVYAIAALLFAPLLLAVWLVSYGSPTWGLIVCLLWLVAVAVLYWVIEGK